MESTNNEVPNAETMVQFQASILIGTATIMMIDAWKENDLKKGRIASSIIQHIENLNADRFEKEATLMGFMFKNITPSDMSIETKMSLVEFVTKCHNIVKAIKHSITVPESASNPKTEKTVLKYLFDKLDDKKASNEDVDPPSA